MLILVIVLVVLQNPGFSAANFSFNSFDPNSCDQDGYFICMGSVVSKNGSLIITEGNNDQKMDLKNSSVNLIGRVLYKIPIVAWPASFSTTFTIRIVVDPDSALSGDGMAFVIAQDNQCSPPESFGSFLGILAPSTPREALRQLAVELDTYKNEYYSDPDGNHIAIDTVSIQNPVVVKSLGKTGIDLKSGRDITVQITYDGWEKILKILVAYSGEPHVEFIKQRIIMKRTVPRQVYIGFTGATGGARESHHVLNWNFTSTELPDKSLKTGEKEYLAEICTIGRLKHKNLLPLEGWCHDRGQLLLVYKYMPNGSLDKSKGMMEENSLVDYVWEAYVKGEILNCVDRDLAGNFNTNQVRRTLMVGLACLHPGSKFRPTMRKVVQVFMNPDEPLMTVPPSRPFIVNMSFSSSAANSTVGGDSGLSMQSFTEEITSTRNP
ncbi:hypothetical protein L2E82_49285 [Cichorium intybus]|uniref:Uncharacterized protein n=1 Tax=Cichorium intybus TaxID=13427 RepID=A0ACB8Z132_CICIN|nr:hypothetical protein L2E82_49285 [Cichorium intybus]